MAAEYIIGLLWDEEKEREKKRIHVRRNYTKQRYMDDLCGLWNFFIAVANGISWNTLTWPASLMKVTKSWCSSKLWVHFELMEKKPSFSLCYITACRQFIGACLLERLSQLWEITMIYTKNCNTCSWMCANQNDQL